MATFVFIIRDPDAGRYWFTDNVKRKDRNIPVDEVISISERDPIWAYRGKAIQGYAQLESSLCDLMAALGGLSNEAATTIFYKITNSGSRNSILEKMLHQKHGKKYNLFWNSYFKELKSIDKKRNEIVHWLAAANFAINEDNILFVGVTLIPPSNRHHVGESPEITSKDLIDFEIRCDEFARLAAVFCQMTNPLDGSPQGATQPYIDIFQHPLVYPLQEDHPILRSLREHDIPPQSSPP